MICYFFTGNEDFNKTARRHTTHLGALPETELNYFKFVVLNGPCYQWKAMPIKCQHFCTFNS